MQNVYEVGEAVRVYDTPFHARQAEHGQPGPSGRSAVIDREMPSDPGHYQVSFAEGEPASAIVTADYLNPLALIRAGLEAEAARREQAGLAAAEEATGHASAAKQLRAQAAQTKK